MPSDSYYRHSGKLTFQGIVLSLGAVIVLPLVLSLFGGAFKLIGTYFIDIGILGVLLTGALTGWLLGKVLKVGKVRNERIAYWLGIFAGILLVLWVWLWFYIFLQMDDLVASIGLPDGVYYPWEDPQRMFRVVHVHAMADGKRAMSALLIYGVAYFTKIFVVVVEFPHFSGPWLYAFWALEAFLLVIWTGNSCKAAAGKHGFVFCEKCNREATIMCRSPLLQPMPAEFSSAIERFRDRIERGSFAALQDLPLAGAVSDPGTFSRLVLRGCKKCRDFYCADIIKVRVEWDSDDYRDPTLREVDDEDDLIVEHLLLPRPWFERMRVYFSDADNTAQIIADKKDGPWLVILVVMGVMALGMAAVFAFDL